jgi:O-methyltransferase involved in polyketide biosynthesis
MNKPQLTSQGIPPDPHSPFFDSSQPNPARVFDYLVGGTANFEVDRAAAEKLTQIWPILPKLTRLRRAFIQEAAQVLYEQGFRQFLDLASGLPTGDHLHAVLPDARVIYSDINPVAINYGESYLAHLEHVAYIYGNAAQVEDILNHAVVQQLFTPGEKVAIGLNALPLFLPQPIIQQLTQKLHAWAPPGSIIFFVFQSRETDIVTETFSQIYDILARTGMPMWLHTTAETLSMLKPWQATLFTPLVEFLGLPDDFMKPEELVVLDMHIAAAFFGK